MKIVASYLAAPLICILGALFLTFQDDFPAAAALACIFFRSFPDSRMKIVASYLAAPLICILGALFLTFQDDFPAAAALACILGKSFCGIQDESKLPRLPQPGLPFNFE